jgi:hypothetical protein
MMSEQPAKNVVSPKDQFNGLSDADRERLVAAIEQTAPDLLVHPFASAIAQRAGADAKFVEELCYFLAEWFALLSENPSEYLERIVEFLAVPEATSESVEKLDTLRGQWRRVMQADATLGVTLKAFDILRRQANSYQKAVTTTEIRPIYLTDPTKAPKHAIVLHQLHVTYQTEYGAQTAHIAIDGPSVAALIGVLQRALTKEQTLIEHRSYDFLGKPKDAKH